MSYNIVYLSPWSVGGFTSFTNHLVRCLGKDVRVFRCNNDRDEDKTRVLKGHGFEYQNVSVKTLLRECRHVPTLITAVARPQDLKDPDTIPKLLRAEAKICVQSTQEFKQFPHVEALRKDGSQVVVIREQLKQYFKGSRYLPHPYVRVMDEDSLSPWHERKPACSTCMLAKNKHPEILLGANEKLPKKLRIDLFGKCTTHFLDRELRDKYPSYVKPDGFRTSAEAAQHAASYRYSVDLSDYPGDGGGTQYSFLEAMDAGAIPVIHDTWAAQLGDMCRGSNCLSVSTADELVKLIREPEDVGRSGALATLADHGPAAIKLAMKRVMR
jgi:hypothetical protein